MDAQLRPAFAQQRRCVLTLYACYEYICKRCGLPSFPISLLPPEFSSLLVEDGAAGEVVPDDKSSPSHRNESSNPDSAVQSSNEENNNEAEEGEHIAAPYEMSKHGLCFVLWTQVMRVVDSYWKLERYKDNPSIMYPTSHLLSLMDSTVSWAANSVKHACYVLDIEVPESVNTCIVVSQDFNSFMDLDATGINLASMCLPQNSQDEKVLFSKISFPRIGHANILKEIGRGNYWAPIVYLENGVRPAQIPFKIPIKNVDTERTHKAKAKKHFSVHEKSIGSNGKSVPSYLSKILEHNYNLFKELENFGLEKGELKSKLEQEKSLELSEMNDLNIHKLIKNITIQLREYCMHVLLSCVVTHKITVDGLSGKDIDTYCSFIYSIGHDPSKYREESKNIFLKCLKKEPLYYTMRSCRVCLVADKIYESTNNTPGELNGTEMFSFAPFTGEIYCDEDPDWLGNNVHYTCEDFAYEEKQRGVHPRVINIPSVGVSFESPFSLYGSIGASRYLSHVIRNGIVFDTVPLKKYKESKHGTESSNLSPKESHKDLAIKFALKKIKVLVRFPIKRYAEYLEGIDAKSPFVAKAMSPFIRIPAVQVSVGFLDLEFSAADISCALNPHESISVSDLNDYVRKKIECRNTTPEIIVLDEGELIEHTHCYSNDRLKGYGTISKQEIVPKKRSYVFTLVYASIVFKERISILTSLGLITRATFYIEWDDKISRDPLQTLIVLPDTAGVTTLPTSITPEKPVLVGDVERQYAASAAYIEKMLGSMVHIDCPTCSVPDNVTRALPLPFLLDLSSLVELGTVEPFTATVVVQPQTYRHLLPNIKLKYAGAAVPLEVVVKSQV